MITTRDPAVVARTVPESKVKWLGRAKGGEFGVINGAEYQVDARSSNPGDYNPRPGELFVMRVTEEMVDGSKWQQHRHHRAFGVTPGTYATGRGRSGGSASPAPSIGRAPECVPPYSVQWSRRAVTLLGWPCAWSAM